MTHPSTEAEHVANAKPDPYGPALALREQIPELVSSRADAVAVRKLARRFDAEVDCARRTAAEESGDVRELRTLLLKRQQAVLCSIANGFFRTLNQHWKELGAILFALFSVVGFLYATQFYRAFQISIGEYLQGIEDLVLIGFLKGAWPSFIALVLAIWVVFIHLWARTAASKPLKYAKENKAAPARFGLVTMVHRPLAMTIVFISAGLAIFLHVPIMAGLAAREPGTGALQVRVAADNIIKVDRLLGSTSNYIFVKVPAPPGSDSMQGLALSKSTVTCIGPRRDPSLPVVSPGYGVPPCDAVLPKDAAVAAGGGKITSAQAHRDVIATFLGCDVESQRPHFMETADFVERSADTFRCPDGHPCNESELTRSAQATRLRRFLEDAGRVDGAFVLGFASQSYDASYNLDLSERRAAFVAKFLGESEWPSRTVAIGVGESPWMTALESSTSRVALVIACRLAPRTSQNARLDVPVPTAG